MSEFWTSSIDDTLLTSKRYVSVKTGQQRFSDWISRYAKDAPTSSNQGTIDVPFQRWFRFKEAYSPKFVTDTIGSLPYNVGRCLDPFGGSGTTALTCRMLGIDSVTTEVNPFLADLIKVKLESIDPVVFQYKIDKALSNLRVSKNDITIPKNFPPTFCAPGVKGRYIFPSDVFGTIRAILRRTEMWSDSEARLAKVLLGSVLIGNSNVRVSGKGRRYRNNWENRERTKEQLIADFRTQVGKAVEDLTEYTRAAVGKHKVLVGDTREKLSSVRTADLAIFSPPYPNSFDYTDVYNVELWMLGYLTKAAQNTSLRQSTLRSHVSTTWRQKSERTAKSKELVLAVAELEDKKNLLWNKNIPDMVQYYYDDLLNIFCHLSRILDTGHHAVVAIGDSQYAGVNIRNDKILPQVVRAAGFELESQGEIRSMRNSSQHGGSLSLAEHCMVFRRVESKA